MKKGFTIVEVSILFVIFLIVAFLVAPLSLDDTMQAKNISKWRNVQQDFSNIFYSINTQIEDQSISFINALNNSLENEIKGPINKYKITYMNGTTPENDYIFDNYKTSFSNAVVSIKLVESPEASSLKGRLMYDVNGPTGPNTWGKDVFGFNIYDTHFEPFGKKEAVANQKKDCSRYGKGIFCSNYYLIGGNFD